MIEVFQLHIIVFKEELILVLTLALFFTFEYDPHTFIVRIYKTKWLSRQKGPSGCQGKRDQVVVKAKGTKCLSG